ncbi:TonB-dependent receptor plug domain-containing protein [Gammaproteobacteria bacterium]|nr:TonB-dependent receptor plug domain-containing protein [Gammaproteobacteria bacterium]
MNDHWPNLQTKINITIMGLLSILFFVPAFAADEAETIESVTIVGSAEDARNLPGSVSVISNEDLKKTMDTDIHKILSAVPGVFFRTEDGYGLRPNISIRGTTIDRSAKVSIMEDGVLVAPAPYTSASAYYFPTTGRIHQVEVVKGPSAITQGPSTIGGAINLISTPIPSSDEGQLVQEIGDNGMMRTHAYFGGSNGTFGALLEMHEHSSDGFDSIANVGGNTGFDKSDFMGKFRYSTGDHELTLKIVEADEISEQSYVGLSQASFNKNPRQRYGMTQYDEMDNDASQQSLTYKGSFGNIDVVATSWSNDYHRDWFKVDKANNTKAHGVSNGINNVISAANGGNANAQAILDGTLAVQVKLKHNNRFYTNEGFQLQASTEIGNHDITVGYRDMDDSESRYQWYECFDQSASGTNSALYACSTGYKGSNNRLRETEASSFFISDTITMGKLAVTLGHRSEEYDKTENRWDDGVATRTVPNSSYVNKTSSGDHSTSGVGATYDMNDNLKLVAGFYQGMSPVFNGDAEEADNMELGFRYNSGATALEVMYFASDYANLVGTCSNSSGGDCEAGQTFSGGEVDVSGLELVSSTVFEGQNGISYPVAITFTSTDATFENSFSNGDYWGTVAAGDDVPYIPSSVLNISAGFVTEGGWSGYLRLADHGSSCSTAACGTNQTIDAYNYMDITIRKAVNANLDVYGVLENVSDNEDVAARAPKDGARSQKPQTFKVGFSYKF